MPRQLRVRTGSRAGRAAMRATRALAIVAVLGGCSARQPSRPGDPATDATGAADGAAPPGAGVGVEEPGRPAEPRALPEPTRLPAIPRVTGPPKLHVQYPRPLQRIAVRDSNFLFGTTGTGDVQLRIDGRPVPVEANGAFLAWLPVPISGRSGSAEYVLVAAGPTGSDTLRHRIRVPAEPYEGPPGTVWLDSASLPAQVERWLLPDEELEFSVRAAPGLSIEVRVGGRSGPLRERRPGVYEGGLSAGDLVVDEPARRSCPADADRRSGCLETLRPDTVRVEVVATDGRRRSVETALYPIAILDPEALPVVELREEPDSVHGSSGVVPGGPAPDEIYSWRFPSGARAMASGRLGDRVRIRLSPTLQAWVAAEDVALAREDARPGSRLGGVEVVGGGGVTTLRLLLDGPVPAHVEEVDPRTLRLLLYGVSEQGEPAREGWPAGAGADELESVAGARRETGPYELTIRMRRPVWGHRLRYSHGTTEETELILEIRSPPEIDPAEPLRGRRVAVDAGHPPGGAFGPTGYYEAEANLAIAYRLVAMLEEAGAQPILTRRDTLPLGLYERTGLAVSAGAELFISIHNNALPDGTRPFGEEGTSTYYYHPHSAGLARWVQTGVLAAMGLPDLGTRRGSFAVVRESWMPSVLAEGAFMMFPRHEAALRTPVFRDAYARGLLWGIEEFLRDQAMEGEAEEE